MGDFGKAKFVRPVKAIRVVGAREHNLKDVEVSIPHNAFVVITGLSGSGKSSLAFDTIYAEGQRRYVESLSSYARQFLGLMEKPDVDYIEGLSPAISIDQKSASRNPRSTVGTITEVFDYLRLLFARAGQPHCPNCGRAITRQSPQTVVLGIEESLRQNSDQRARRLAILSPLVKDRKGEHKLAFKFARKSGFARVRLDGVILDLDEAESYPIEKKLKHSIEVVVDRLIFDPKAKLDRETRSRLFDSVEKAIGLSLGTVIIHDLESKTDQTYSEHFACPDCNVFLPEIQPRNFSFNSPHGACSACQGLGTKLEVNFDLVVPNRSLTLAEGAIRPWARSSSYDSWYVKLLNQVAKANGFSVDQPVADLSELAIEILMNGAGQAIYHIDGYETVFEGLANNLMRRFKETDSDYVRSEMRKYMVEKICQTCNGGRLKKEFLGVLIGEKNIVEVNQMTIEEAFDFVVSLDEKTIGSKELLTVGRQIFKELKNRLDFLKSVGLSYLTLDRSAATLAGGEAQRIRLATQIGSSLTGVLYILDEPSIGLHQRDNQRLLGTIEALRDLGNTVIVVEHDRETIEAADFILDIGPGAGEYGGRVVAAGDLQTIKRSEQSLTGQYLSGKKSIPIPKKRRRPSGEWLEIVGAAENNLKNLDVRIPLRSFVLVTGVSGSGKSTLISDILAKALATHFHRSRVPAGKHTEIRGLSQLNKVIDIDQSPIGRTPRSNPATYTGVFTPIRELFASTNEAKMRGYRPGRFSFNVKGGRCENCSGDGVIKIEMHFLADVYITCEECRGRRYNQEALDINYRGKTIADVLEMTVEEARQFFDSIPQIRQKLSILNQVGLSYIRLGQPATTLSGGEAQRIKLASELSHRATGKTLYILDEPTTGLHFEDIRRLLEVLQALVDKGNTVLVIEHNLEVIKSADWLIDLGPEGGTEGGRIIAEGPPEKVAQVKESYTGQYLLKFFSSVANKDRSLIKDQGQLKPVLAKK